MQFTVKRSEWCHGEDVYLSKLLRTRDEKKCCLGFLGLACGLTEDQIREVHVPWNLGAEGIEKFPAPFQNSVSELNYLLYLEVFEKVKNNIVFSNTENTMVPELIISCNDKRAMFIGCTQAMQEEFLTKAFSILDITVTFEE